MSAAEVEGPKVTLDEMRAIIRGVLAEHESEADRYFAHATLLDLAGYLKLCEERGHPVEQAAELRWEIEALLPMLDEARVPSGWVAVQLALARLDQLRELPSLVEDIEIGGTVGMSGDLK